MTMMKTTSLLETAEKTLGVRWPYTVADIERAKHRLEGRARKNDPKLIQSAVTQCRIRAREALATKVSTRNQRSTRRRNSAAPQPECTDSNLSDTEPASLDAEPSATDLKSETSRVTEPDLQQRIAAAKASAEMLASIETKHSKVRDKHAFPFLEEAYGILKNREQDPVAYERFITGSGAVATTGRKPSEYREVINALFTKEQRRCFSAGYLSNCANALYTAEKRNVPVGGVSQWLRNSEIVSDRHGPVKGLAKVRAIKEFVKRKSDRAMEAAMAQDQDQQHRVAVQDALAQVAEHPDFTLTDNDFLNRLRAQGCTNAVFVASLAPSGVNFRLMSEDRGKVELHVFVNEHGKPPPSKRKRS